MKKNILIFTIFLITLIFLGFFYLKNNRQESTQLFSSEVFALTENPNTLILKEEQKLSQESINEYQKRILKIENDLREQGAYQEWDDADFFVINYNNLAIYESYLGNYEKAYKLYLKSLELEDRRITWIALGSLLVKMKALESSEAVFQKAISMNEYDPGVYIKLADLYKQKNELEKIRETYENALLKDHENTLILSDYAKWLAEIKEYEEAIEVYERLKAEQPNNTEAINRKIQKIKLQIDKIAG